MILSAILPLIAQLAGSHPLDQSLSNPGNFDEGPFAETRVQAPQRPEEKDRMTVCLTLVRTDPGGAIATANRWAGETSGSDRAFPGQCLGMAYTRLLRWDAAEQAFLAARDAAAPDNNVLRSRLAAMAGNAALAGGNNEAALADLAIASGDAAAAGDTVAKGEIQIDRSRALVTLGRMEEAAQALAAARRDAPLNSDGWLLSATLARRGGDLVTAQAQIETAAGLDRTNPAIGLEAGLIAALGGRDDAARKSWQSVIGLAPGTPEAEAARAYLDQLGGGGTAGGESGTGR